MLGLVSIVLLKPVVFLIALLLLATMVWLTLKTLGGHLRFGTVYYTVRSWIVLLSLLLVGLVINTPDFAFGIALLAVLMALKGQHEIRRLFRQFPSQTTKQRYLDRLFILVFSLFIIAFIDLGTSLNQQHQLGILIFVIFVIQFNDIGQYLMGRLLGQRLFKRKLAPIISPNKTIEGALVGCMLTSALSLPIGKFLTPFNYIQIFILAWILTSIGIVGDLLESAVKRSHGVKDMGRWLKGHGGIIDRIDSLMLAVPAFWLIYRTCLS